MLIEYILSRVCHLEEVLAVTLLIFLSFFFFFAIYGVVCVKLAPSSFGDRGNALLTHLIIIIKLEVLIFPFCCHTFPWLCTWGGCTIICCWFHINPEKAGFCFLYYCLITVLWYAHMIEYIMTRPMVAFVCLHIALPYYHHYAGVSEGMELVRYGLSSVCLRFNEWSQLSFMQYMRLCLFSLSIYLVVIARIHVLYLIIIIKSEVWAICLCLG